MESSRRSGHISPWGAGQLPLMIRWCHWRRWPAYDLPPRNQKIWFRKKMIPQLIDTRTLNINEHQSMNILIFQLKLGFSVAILDDKSDQLHRSRVKPSSTGRGQSLRKNKGYIAEKWAMGLMSTYIYICIYIYIDVYNIRLYIIYTFQN